MKISENTLRRRAAKKGKKIEKRAGRYIAIDAETKGVAIAKYLDNNTYEGLSLEEIAEKI